MSINLIHWLTLECQAPWYEGGGNPKSTLPTLFAEHDPRRHSASRRKVASAYSMTNMVSLKTFVDSCTEILLEKLHTFARNDVLIHVPHWTQCYAFDVTTSKVSWQVYVSTFSTSHGLAYTVNGRSGYFGCTRRLRQRLPGSRM
jgi:hypothetical protein